VSHLGSESTGHPILPKDVETGPGAEKLQALKEQLKKRHTVSFFSTPEDLQARIMYDVPSQLRLMGVEVTDREPGNTLIHSVPGELVRRYRAVSRRFLLQT
jgi:hypothetical protein